MVRGTVILPHGLGGKAKRVLVIASGEKLKEGQDAGAEFVGGEDMVTRIQSEQWLDYDAIVATPDMMKSVGKLGKILGPRGLMPNPKTGTVTDDVGRAVREFKGGRVEYRTDRYGNIHVPIGKASFTKEQIAENATSIISSIVKARPSAVKGTSFPSLPPSFRHVDHKMIFSRVKPLCPMVGMSVWNTVPWR